MIGPCDSAAKATLLQEVTDDLRGRIIFTGFVNYEEKLRLYSLARMFVFPSLDEGFGLPVLEAMAAGLPVICSDLDVLREVGGDTAVYFQPKNVEVLTESMASMLTDASPVDNVSAEGQKRARDVHLESNGSESDDFGSSNT